MPVPGTEQILTAYARGHEAGIAAYAEAVENSSTAPPDTGLLAWGSVMGPDERAAYDACAAAVELAIARRELSSGARGWRAKRRALIDRWLTTPPPAPTAQEGGRHRAHHAPGVSDTWLARIHTERMDAWANSRRANRSRLAAAVLPRLLEGSPCRRRTRCPPGWLLGTPTSAELTQARHYIRPRSVSQGGGRVRAGGSSCPGPAARKWTCSRCTRCAGWPRARSAPIRPAGTSLVLRGPGPRRLMAEDPAMRWRIGTAALVGTDDAAAGLRGRVRRRPCFLLVAGRRLRRADRHLARIHTEEGSTSRGRPTWPRRCGAKMIAWRHQLSAPAPSLYRAPRPGSR